jgi:MinD-like ATPase involved in chromosome partitioning or flagellar assembly
MGARGGVGTTTLALSAADLLSRQNSTVVAVELSSCDGGFADHLHQPPAPRRPETGTDPVTRESVTAALQPVSPRLRLLIGAPKPGTSATAHGQETERLLRLLATMVDHVVVDLPSRPCEASRAAMRVADAAVMVVEPVADSIQAARSAAEMMSSWGLRTDSLGAVIVSRSDRVTELSVPEMTRALPMRIVGRIPFVPDACRYAHDHGVTLFSALSDRSEARPLTWVTNALVASAELDCASLLLIDERGEDEQLLELLRDVDAGHFQISRASGTDESVAIARAGDFDVAVLCDSPSTPVRPEAITKLRVAAPRVLIVVLTHGEGDEARRRFLRLGAHECLPRKRAGAFWLGWALRTCIEHGRKLTRAEQRIGALEEAQAGYRRLVGTLLREGGKDQRMV